ncbi:ATP-dependent bile acid permease [Rhodotorula toruloides]|nr:ATP-dependent bile acid permease [Rhodotorula toruloides]
MLVLGVSVAALRLTTPTRPALHPALALAPHLLLALSVISSIAWIAWVHVRAARRRDAAHATVSNGTAGSLAERQPLLNGEDDSVRSGVKLGGEDSEGPTGWELLLGIAKVLVAVALVGVTVGKLLGVEDGSKTRWTRVFEGGMIAVPAYVVVMSAAIIADNRLTQLVRIQQAAVSSGLVLFSAAVFVWPFLFFDHPTLTAAWRLGFVQAALATTLCLIMLATPTRYQPRLTGAPPNPAQAASPLSRLFFSFLESRMVRYYAATSSRLDRFLRLDYTAKDFASYVPPLSDILHSDYVLRRFRWTGDPVSSRDDDEDGEQEEPAPRTGEILQFAMENKKDLLIIVAFASSWIGWIFVTPLSMNLLLRYVQQSESPPFGLSPYLFVVLILVAPIASSVSYQSALYRLALLGLRLRAVLGHAIYAKLLRIKAGGGSEKHAEKGKPSKQTSGAGGSEAVGRVNNLVGTDIDGITSSLASALQLLGVLPKLVVSLVFLYFLLGWSAFVALGSIVLFAPISNVVSRRYGAVQEEIMQATDKRITLVQELLNSIRTLKMFAWEKPSMKRIGEARDMELGRITKRAKVYGGMMFLSTGVPAVVTLSTFGAYIFLQHQSLTASTAFTAMSLFGLLREAVISATYLLSAFMRARVSLGRITRFIQDTEELDERARTFVDSPSAGSSTAINGDATDEAGIAIEADSIFRFSRYDDAAFTLTLTGDGGSTLRFPRGKTTIIAGDVGSGKSALLLALLGELHVVSGGVQLRSPHRDSVPKLSFAAQSPWLQDTSVRQNILFGEEYDDERYRETIFACALEDDLEALPEGDETRVGERGLSMSGGQKQRIALARAIYARSDIVLLDDVLSALDSNMVQHVVEHCLDGPLLENRTVVLVTHFTSLCVRKLQRCALVVELHDGKVTKAAAPSTQLEAKSNGMTRSSSSTSLRSERSNPSKGSKNGFHAAEVKHGRGVDENRIDSSGEGTDISWTVYRKYAAAMGGLKFWIPYAVVNIVAHVFMLGQGWFVGRWVGAPDRDVRAARYFSLYAGIQIVASVSLTAMYLLLIWGGIRASRLMHRRLTDRIFAAPFRWWDRTPVSHAINRFSKDTEVLDTEQVENLSPVLDYGCQVLFVAVVICVALPVFLLPAAIISAVFFCIGRLYVRNALAARKEVAAARAPLFSTLGDSTSGVTTIRAFGRQEHFARQYKEQTDTYNQVQLYAEGLDRWLEERSDMVGATVSFIVGLLCLSSGLSSGVTGFLISTGLEFTSRILYVVRAVNKNELSLNSVQRIIQYSTEVETEEPASDKKDPPAHWPDSGAIEFKSFSAKYSEGGNDVLRELSLSIKSGEKIGIVGPSGCGKSTLSLALLRFILTSKGSIEVDGRRLSDTNLQAIRSRFTLVPQDPTLFSGTLRSNLDPNGEHDDATLWNAIKRSGLARAGNGDGLSLDTPVASSGSNFSQGQRQLIGLARALVRNSRVIVMDEATASLDNESDKLVQRVVREEFRGCTNLTVAHRLETIIDFDRVLVLRGGKVVEFDAPAALLDKRDGAFREMVEATGNFNELKRKAQKGKAKGGSGSKGACS